MATLKTPQVSIPQPIGATLARTAALITEQQQRKSKPDKERDMERQKWLRAKLQMDISHPQLEAAIPPLADFVFAVLKRTAGGTLVIHGKNGSGKTHIAHAVDRIFCENRMNIGSVTTVDAQTGEGVCNIADCRFLNWPRVVKEVHADQWLVFDYAASEYLTILDDIGAEHDPSSNGLAQLYLILNRREFKHTLITTNFPPAAWEAKFEKRIASRLIRNAMHIDLSNVPDFNARPL